ncbi:hypothetical protein SUNI508_02891 [Seiridium unicorne]|uniref:Peptidase S53 domain-containing protein n=1 Tax=Seiridium unicorne TaxID=138068 RepID=A0ABR2VJ43_9PEZI
MDLKAKNYYESNKFVNFSGRAYPDIAAYSRPPNYAVFIADTQDETGGTSAAAPLVAGVIALVNDARLRAGKPIMGFLNPFIYSLKTGALIDVVMGAAVGCTVENTSGAGNIPRAAWNSTVGWDPATGMGLPYFEELVKVAMEIV